MIEKKSEILNSLIFSLRLSTPRDCSIVLMNSSSKIFFQHFDNSKQKKILEQRIKLIEWSSIIEYSSKVSKNKINVIVNYYKENTVFLKFINNSIMMIALNNKDVDTSEVNSKIEEATMELKTYCNEAL